MDSETISALRLAADAMRGFNKKFGIDLSFSKLCEMYAALQLGLPLPPPGNQKGYDLKAVDSTRYQIKGLRGGTQNVDTRNFDFDYLVLVNLSNDYRPTGMWKLDVAKARSIFVERVTFRKYQLTHKASSRLPFPSTFRHFNQHYCGQMCAELKRL